MKPKPKREIVIHRPIPMECCACHDRLGPKELPVDVPEDDGDGAGKTDRWCPACFVSIRAYKDARWRVGVLIGQILALSCSACGVTSVAFGRKTRMPTCGQCGSPRIVAQLPKGTVLKVGALRAAGFI